MKQAWRAGDMATYNALAGKHKQVELRLGDALYVNAYLLLDGERSDELSPIPWSSMIQFCREYDLTIRQRDDMVDYIFRIDNKVIAERAKEAKRRNQKDGNSTTSRSQNSGNRRSRS